MKAITKKYLFMLILPTFYCMQVHAQSTISGTVVGSNNKPVTAATVRLPGTGAGTTTDSMGNFSLTTTATGKHLLQVSSLGYSTKAMELMLVDSLVNLHIVLSVEAKTLGEVVVVGAGSFEASDKAKGASLSPIDAV